MEDEYLKGRGAQFNPANRFLKNELTTEHIEGLDEKLLHNEKTVYLNEYPKNIVNAVDSPDIGFAYSLNPYQGCEHGCIYCYARNSHEYWGYSAGLDFERKIIVKPEAISLLRTFLAKKGYEPKPIMISGNTDCYQPIERKMRLTRGILELCLEHYHPVNIITKNALILRDLDILEEMAKKRLVRVAITVTSLEEEIRLKLEPRTASYQKRLGVIKTLHEKGIGVIVMVAPIIPGLTSDGVPNVIKAAAEHGAHSAGMTIVRLNGAIKDIFKDWLYKNCPDRADKVWHHIQNCHGGQVNDSRFGTRMKGEGNIAKAIVDMFKLSVKRYMTEPAPYSLDCSKFIPPGKHGQLNLF